MIEPAHTEIETADVLVFSRCGNGFVHGRKRVAKQSKVGLENGHMQKRVLVVALISRLHSVVEVAVQIVEGFGIIPSSPCIKEPRVHMSNANGYECESLPHKMQETGR